LVTADSNFLVAIDLELHSETVRPALVLGIHDVGMDGTDIKSFGAGSARFLGVYSLWMMADVMDTTRALPGQVREPLNKGEAEGDCGGSVNPSSMIGRSGSIHKPEKGRVNTVVLATLVVFVSDSHFVLE
jgi:hypothetical protein